MTPISRSASAARWLVLACLAPILAFAQAPAQPAPAPAAKDAPKAPSRASPPAGSEPQTLDQKFAREAFPAPPGVGDTPPATGPLAPLSWLTGCWWGDVNKREFREYWHPLRGDMMIGVSRLAFPERVLSFEYLRLESRPDGVYYVNSSQGRNEIAFKLTSTTKEGDDELYKFTTDGTGFPNSILYRRAGGGWLYVEVAGMAQGQDHKVIYPFRRVSCETGEFIRK